MTLEQAQQAIERAEAQLEKARESLVKAVILEEGADPRTVEKIEVTGFRSLVQSLLI